MGETLNLLFRSRDDNTFGVEVKESWSGRVVSGSFVPPFTSRQLNALQKKLNSLESGDAELRDVGERLFLALCSASTSGSSVREPSDQPVRAVLRSVIQRTLRRRGTVALTFSFTPECAEFARYPWELLHNGEHFLLASGVFTLTRMLLRPDAPVGCELPVHPPMSMLYIGASPCDCSPLEIERSFEALKRGLSRLLESGQLSLNRLEPATFDELVRYLNSYGGVGIFDDSETRAPCYIVHFDGHGAHGRLCPREECSALNEPDERKCVTCGTSLNRVKAQTYLCFCNDEGSNRYIDTQSLRDLFMTSDVRLAVFSACETATLTGESARHQRVAFDTTLATALVTAQVPAVVAMPFSLQDDLSPTFMFHFYEALADGRTLEEALSRARHAMLPMHQKGWFIPVLYRHVSEGQEGPVALLAHQDDLDESDHPLAHLGASTNFVGREQEVQDLGALLTAAARGEEQRLESKGQYKLRPGMRHLALTGPAGIGKSALAFEVVRRNQSKFPGPGGVIGISLQGGKLFAEALIEIAHYLPNVSTRSLHTPDVNHRERLVLNAFRARVSRELPCLLLIDSFEEVKEQAEIKAWLRFLCDLPEQAVVMLTSRSNPAAMGVLEGASCRWYEYSVGKMNDEELLKLFTELAAESGLDKRIHLDDPVQQETLREICTLLDGYPLGAELIFGTAHSIGGKVYTPEAATRSLEEVRDELRDTPLAGIWAVLEVAYLRLSPSARLLLSYLATFKLPFSSKQIVMLVAPESQPSSEEPVSLEREHHLDIVPAEKLRLAGEAAPRELARNWRAARDELVQASFMGFDGRVYTIHAQVRNFALSYLPQEERGRVHRVAAAYYLSLPHPSPEEWFAAFEHLEGAGEPQDLQEAVRLAVRASWDLSGRGHAPQLLAMLRKAEFHALRLKDRTGEGQIQCCLGAILRQLGKYAEAVGCLTRSLTLHREQQESDEAGWALYELAMLCREEGNFQQATQYAQEALDLFRETGDKKGEAWMQMVQGQVSRGYGKYYDALGRFDMALRGFRDLYNDEGCAWTLRDRGTVHEALGHYSEALVDYDEALRLFTTLGLRSGQAWVSADQCVVYTDRGKLDLAERACHNAIVIFHEQGIRRGEGWALRAMGDILRERHNYGDARSYYEKAAAIFGALGDRVDLARVVNAQGALSFDEGEPLAAKEYYEQALSLAHEQGVRQLEGRASRGLGDVARVMRSFADAEHYYQIAAEIATDLDTPAELRAVLHRQGDLCHARGQSAEALDRWLQALALDRRLGHPARQYLQNKVDTLVTAQHLEETHAELSKKYGLGDPT
ncbi:MAG: tetratricopeptide repeat protein [Chloroflexota bacterium]|nr:tetratricopeptide repeat protein [Chloroflexota bacterium]